MWSPVHRATKSIPGNRLTPADGDGPASHTRTLPRGCPHSAQSVPSLSRSWITSSTSSRPTLKCCKYHRGSETSAQRNFSAMTTSKECLSGGWGGVGGEVFGMQPRFNPGHPVKFPSTSRREPEHSQGRSLCTAGSGPQTKILNLQMARLDYRISYPPSTPPVWEGLPSSAGVQSADMCTPPGMYSNPITCPLTYTTSILFGAGEC